MGGGNRRWGTVFFVVMVVCIFLAAFGLASVFLFHDLFHLTSSNSAIYILRGTSGGIDLRRDMLVEDGSRLIFMLDANCVFSIFMRKFSEFARRPLLELTWWEGEGEGVIKKFGEDGSILEVAFSRFRDVGTPKGLFIGGDLPYGDVSRDESKATSGMGYFDGKKWTHLWCAANEGFNISGTGEMLSPEKWKYMGSRVLKDTYDEVDLESYHQIEISDKRQALMTRRVRFRATDDFLTLGIKIANPNTTGFAYTYIYGDEPWVGGFGSSWGDVGWFEGGLIEKETSLDPVKYKYAGYWDHGIASVDRGGEGYSGYANFIKWVSPTPDLVYLANEFSCCDEKRPLDSAYKRVIGIEWHGIALYPGESRTHVLVLGKAKVRNGLPAIPYINPE